MNEDHGKIRARLRQGKVEVKVLIRHPMEMGNRTDAETGETVQRHFIQEVVCEHNGRPVMRLDWGWGISEDPYLAFTIRSGQPGDRVSVRWVDNLGEQAALETEVR